MGLLDVAGYYRPLLGFLRSMVDEGFLGPEHLEDLVVDTQPGILLDHLEASRPLATHKRPERSRPLK